MSAYSGVNCLEDPDRLGPPSDLQSDREQSEWQSSPIEISASIEPQRPQNCRIQSQRRRKPLMQEKIQRIPKMTSQAKYLLTLPFIIGVTRAYALQIMENQSPARKELVHWSSEFNSWEMSALSDQEEVLAMIHSRNSSFIHVGTAREKQASWHRLFDIFQVMIDQFLFVCINIYIYIY
jgi:hypothetical protein